MTIHAITVQAIARYSIDDDDDCLRDEALALAVQAKGAAVVHSSLATLKVYLERRGHNYMIMAGILGSGEAITIYLWQVYLGAARPALLPRLERDIAAVPVDGLDEHCNAAAGTSTADVGGTEGDEPGGGGGGGGGGGAGDSVRSVGDGTAEDETREARELTVVRRLPIGRPRVQVALPVRLVFDGAGACICSRRILRSLAQKRLGDGLYNYGL